MREGPPFVYGEGQVAEWLYNTNIQVQVHQAIFESYTKNGRLHLQRSSARCDEI